MNLTTRWYPVRLLRNALGRFMALRVPRLRKPRHRRTIRPAIVAVQVKSLDVV